MKGIKVKWYQHKCTSYSTLLGIKIEFILEFYFFSLGSQCHAFLCIHSWALVTNIASVQNVDTGSTLFIKLGASWRI